MKKRIPLFKQDSAKDLQLLSGYICVLRKTPFSANTIVGVEVEGKPGYYDFDGIVEGEKYQRWIGTTLVTLAVDLSFSGDEGVEIAGSGDCLESVGFITQSGASNPVIYEKSSSFNETITIERESTGTFLMTFSNTVIGAANILKINLNISDSVDSTSTAKKFRVEKVSLAGIRIFAYLVDGVTLTDGIVALHYTLKKYIS